MAREHFLVNPRRIRRTKGKRIGAKRRRKGGLPSALLRRMMKTYGPRSGMKRAWAVYRKGVRRNVWSGHRQAHRRASQVGWSSRRVGIRGHKKPSGARYPKWNPFGEEVMIVGANPRRKRRKEVLRMKVRRRRHKVRRKRARMSNPRRRVYRRHRRAYALSPIRRRRHRRSRRNRAVSLYRRNPIRRSGRRRNRGNPAMGSSVPAISFRRPMSMLMPCAIGVASYMACDYVPTKLGMAASPLQRLGVKAGVGFGGMMLLGRFIGRQNAAVWGIVAGVNILQDILKTYIFKTAVAGLGMYVYPGYSGVGAYPQEGYSPYYDSSPY